MKIESIASGASASMRVTTPSRIALAVLVACMSAAASNVSGAAESVEADKKAAVEEREAAERERKLNEARKRLDAAAREVAELSRAMSEDAMPRVARIMSRQASRAMLGVNIGGSARDDEREDGVEIISVSPGGPAAEAGLKAGDVLVDVDGKSLKQEGSATPREKLLAAMRDVDPEEKIKVRYLRDGKPATVTVVARRTDPMFTMPLRIQGLEHLPTLAFMRSHGAFGSAELVAMTPKLGNYFGTDKGLLVVRAPADSRLKLEEGDVLLDIDGRVPNSTSHAVRILSSYQPGEKMKLNVMRMKKRMTIDVTVPEDALEHSFRESDDMVVPAPPPVPAPAPGARSDAA